MVSLDEASASLPITASKIQLTDLALKLSCLQQSLCLRTPNDLAVTLKMAVLSELLLSLRESRLVIFDDDLLFRKLVFFFDWCGNLLRMGCANSVEVVPY